MLPGTDHLDQLGDRIRREIETSVTIDQHQEIRVTVSLGAVAFSSTDVTDIDDLVRHADAAMYVAKAAGRNRFV